MDKIAETLLDQALQLPPSDRAALAENLLASLDEVIDPEVEAAWMAVASRRMEEARKNPELLLDGEQVFAELRREFGVE